MSSKKSVQKNYIFNLIYEILVLLLPLITTPYLSRVLGADGVGIYNYTRSIVVYFVLISAFGFKMYGQREIAFVQHEKNKRSQVFWEIFILKCFTYLIGLVIYYICFCIYGKYTNLYYIYLIYIIANMLDVTWFFQGMEEFPKIVVRNAIIKVLDIVLIFVFVRSQNDLWKYVLIFSGDTFFSCVCLIPFLKKYVDFVPAKSLNFKKHLKPSFLLFIPQIAIQLYTLLDSILLGALSTTAEVGCYAQAEKIIKFTLTILTSLSGVLMPRISNFVAKGDLKSINKFISVSFKVIVLIGTPMSIGMFCIAEQFVPLFLGDGFENSINVLRILSFLFPVMGLSYLFGLSYLVPLKRQKQYTISVLANAAVNLVLDFALIPNFGSIGAAFATIVAEMTTLFIQVHYIRKEINVLDFIKDCKSYLVAGVIMGFIIIAPYQLNFSINIYIIVLIGIISYFSFLFLIKDKMFFYFIRIIKNKILKKGNIYED